MPIIFLQMDSYKGQSCSTTIPNLVPFAAQISKSKIDKKYYRTQLPLAMAQRAIFFRSQEKVEQLFEAFFDFFFFFLRA